MKISNLFMLLGVLCTLILGCCAGQRKKKTKSTSVTDSSVSENTMASTDIATQADNNESTSPSIISKKETTSAEANPAPTAMSMKEDKPESSKTTTLSYEQWKAENEKRLDEKYDDKRREDQDRANNDLLRNIQSALARPDLTAAKQAQLDFVSNLLKKAALVNDPSVKKAAYDEALGALISVLSP